MKIFRASIFLATALIVSTPGFTQSLDVPIEMHSQCGDSRVIGLDPNGDGFLSVRSGPGTEFRKLDEVYNGDRVRIFSEQWPWVGIVYGMIPNWGSGQCNIPRGLRRGWVHTNWLDIG